MENLTLIIEPDSDPISPRNNDHLGTIAAYHRRYGLSNKVTITVDEAKEILEDTKNYYSRTVYGYEHGGIVLSLDNSYPFNCPWDGSTVGVIYCPKKKAREEGLSEAQVYAHFKAEIEEYNHYLTGDVWGYVIEDKDGNTIDACWGFYGHEYAESEGKAARDYWEKRETKESSWFNNQL